MSERDAEIEAAAIATLRESAAGVIAARLKRWHADKRLQFQYSIREYTSMSFEEWAAWNRDGTVSNRLARVWGGRL